MKRTLGLDLGTNSIGWAIVLEDENGKRITPKAEKIGPENPVLAGAVIFSEGVGRDDKGREVPATELRTRMRAMRRLYMRRRMRKHRLLKALITNGMCPMSINGLEAWKNNGEYPSEPALIEWFKLNPYELRARGLDHRLEPLELGRILYHLAQRRGFQSNRKTGDQGDQENFNSGNEETGITGYATGYNNTLQLLSEYRTLGEAGAALGERHEAIRRRYFKRANLIDEFELIWEKQCSYHTYLTPELKTFIGDRKEGTIFFQRPLKSKKSEVGRCTLEPGKKRAPISSISAELFGVLHTINNIKVNGENLTQAGRDALLPLFFRKSKPNFPIGDVRGALKKAGITGTLNYEKWEIRAEKDKKEVKVMGARTIANLADIWGVDPMEIVRAFGPMREEDAAERQKWDDRWNVIYNEQNDWGEISDAKDYDGKKRDLKGYAREVWKLSDEQLEKLKDFNPKDGYHSLSSRAINRILPYLYDLVPYHYAVFYANLPTVLKVMESGKVKEDRWASFTAAERKKVTDAIAALMDEHRTYRRDTRVLNGLIEVYRSEHGEHGGSAAFWNNTWETRLAKAINEQLTKEQQADRGYVADLNAKIKMAFLHHIESHQKVRHEKPLRLDQRIKTMLADEYGVTYFWDPETGEESGQAAKLYHPSAINIYPQQRKQLGSPKTPGLKNPIVYRALNSLRLLVNRLIEEGMVDRDTHVHIEMARQLDSANKRKAWERYQRDMRVQREEAYTEAKKCFNGEPGEREIELMWLWLEAERLWGSGKVHCIYTGKHFGCHELFSGNYEVEHTWPLSRTNDNSKANKFLCDKEYNAQIKRNRLPSELSQENYDKEWEWKGKMLPAITTWITAIEEKVEGLETAIAIRKNRSRNAVTKQSKDIAIQERHYYQFHLNYWKTKLSRLTAKEIKPGFLNSQLVATGQITKLARGYMNSYFKRVVCYKAEALSMLRKEWTEAPKTRDVHTHHAVDASICATVDRDVFNELAHHFGEHDERGDMKRFPPPWTNFGGDMVKVKESALMYHIHKPALGRTSTYKRTEHGANGKATGSTVRGSLHKDTYYGKIKLKKEGTDEYTEHVVVRKMIVDMTDAEKKRVVDPALMKALVEADPALIAKHRGLPWKGKYKGEEVVRIVRHARIFVAGLKNPLPIKAHRDQKEGSEHKHFLWAKNDENPVMALYENAKGKTTHHVFSLMDITKALQAAGGVKNWRDALPDAHPDPKREGFVMQRRNGKRMILQVGQLVVLYNEHPDEFDIRDTNAMNRRTYVLRKVEPDARVNLANVMDARKDIEPEVSTWEPEKPLVWLRRSVNGLNALFDGIDIELGPVLKS